MKSMNSKDRVLTAIHGEEPDRVPDILATDVRYIWSGFTDLGGARMDSDCKNACGAKSRFLRDSR